MRSIFFYCCGASGVVKEKSTFSPTFIAEESSGKCTTTAAGVVISSKLLKTDGRYEVMLEKITPKNTELKIVVSDSSNSSELQL